MTTARSLDVLLGGLVDYAGLFPPAALTMLETVEGYSAYRRSERLKFLGRLIVPASRLDELESEAALLLSSETPWRISALAGSDLAADASAIALFNKRHRESGDALIDAVEAKAADLAGVDAIATAFGRDLDRFVEVDAGEGLESRLDAIVGYGMRAKIRTGGVVPGAIPPVDLVAQFLMSCAERRLPFKATAGLHHPLRSVHRLTYEADAPTGLMHGFLNVFLAAAFAWNGLEGDGVLTLLDERSAAAFEFGDDSVRWSGREIEVEDLQDARRLFARSFGSCSFREPIEDMEGLKLL